MNKSVYRVLILTFFLSLGFAHEIYLRRAPVQTYEEYQEEVIKKKKKKSREPASYQKAKITEAPAHSPQQASQPDERRDPVFREEPVSDDTSGSSESETRVVGYYQSANSDYGRMPQRNPSNSSREKSSSSSDGSSQSSTSSQSLSNIGGGIICPGDPLCPTDSDSTDETDDSSSTESSSTSTTPDLTCSANVGGGNYGNPIEVTLSCSTTAMIKYCLQEGSCCDPTTGTTYSSPLVIGATDGSYCLRFYGDNSTKVSTITEVTYNINSSLPDLLVTHTKIQYQTTQLPGRHTIDSNDFGQANFWLGEINLKSHDPGSGGLNLSCQEIVENHSSLTSPSPQEVFTPMDMALIASGSQVEVPVSTAELAYGDNFLTSYILDDNYAAPLYSCSTNKIILKDFEFFAIESCHGDAGTNQVREFSGAFTSYGIFEQASVIPRAPAGSATEEQNTQELRVGSFAVFY